MFKSPFDDFWSGKISEALGLPKTKGPAESVFENFDIFKSFSDNVLKTTVTPVKGSVVYCVLTGFEHSGIYVGNGEIVHLDGSGMVESVTPQVFLNRLDGLNQAITVYVSCDASDNPVGSYMAAARASLAIGKKRNYRLTSKNCHQFSASCLTGDSEISSCTFSSLKKIASSEIGFRNWRAWTSSDYASP